MFRMLLAAIAAVLFSAPAMGVTFVLTQGDTARLDFNFDAMPEYLYTGLLITDLDAWDSADAAYMNPDDTLWLTHEGFPGNGITSTYGHQNGWNFVADANAASRPQAGAGPFYYLFSNVIGQFGITPYYVSSCYLNCAYNYMPADDFVTFTRIVPDVVTPVPIPAAFPMLLLGLGALALAHRYRA